MEHGSSNYFLQFPSADPNPFYGKLASKRENRFKACTALRLAWLWLMQGDKDTQYPRPD